MRNLIIGLSLLAIFMVSYTLGSALRGYPLSPREAFFSKSKPVIMGTHAVNATRPAPGAAAPPAKPGEPPAKDPVEAVQTSRGSELTHALRALPHVQYNRLHEALRRRFQQDYPRNEHEHLKETAGRINIVGALSSYGNRMMTKAEQQQLTNFLEEVASAPGESPAVRARAAEVLAGNLGKLEEDQRLDALAAMGNRDLNLTSRQPAEVLEDVFRAEVLK